MILRNSHILIMIVTLLMSSKEHPYVDPTYRLINTTTEYLAGDNIVLEISATTDDIPLLKIMGNQGIILIKPIKNDAYLKYPIPQFISNEAGVFYWKLLQTNLEGKLKILPKNIHHIESYVGPPTLEASKDDFTMITILPVDEFDNPQLDSTTVTLKNFIDFKKEEKDLMINDLFTFDILNAPTSTGKLITTVTSGNVSSKEHTIDIMAGRAVDFTLSRKRNHPYADGNQTLQLITSSITDRYGNTVSDGTLVTFYVQTENGTTRQTTATTINGVATANLLHPEKAESWEVRALIPNMAVSNYVKIEFLPAIKDFDIQITGRSIKVTSLTSFLGQIIPDGFTVEAIIVGNDSDHNLNKGTLNGDVTFYLDPNVFEKGDYDIKITAGGIVKHLKNVAVE